MRERIRDAAVAMALLAGAAAFYARGDRCNLSPCLFKHFTGIPCPGCGGLRAADRLLHGHAVDALLINPLSVLVMIFLLLSVCWLSRDAIRGRSTYWSIYRRRWSRPLVIATVVALLAQWTWNIWRGL
jgi:hypothetical protein